MSVPAEIVARPAPPPDARPRRPPAIHPCIAYPDLYPDVGPPLGAGLIRGNACALLMGVIHARLLDLGLARDSFAVGIDVYVYADQRRASPDVCVYLHLNPARGNAGAFHVDFDGPPALVIEVLSKSTWEKDMGLGDTLEDKKRFYREISVVEYWIYDPETRRKDGGGLLEGFRLAEGGYARIAPQAGYWYSDVLQAYWGIGAPFQAGPRAYASLRLRKPGASGWYPIAEELEGANTELGKANTELKETNTELKETNTELEEANAKLKAEVQDRAGYIAWLEAQLRTRDGQNPKPSAPVV